MQNEWEKQAVPQSPQAFILPELAHEIRNLMQSVQGLAELEQQLALNPVSAMRLKKIAEMAQSASELSTALMSLSDSQTNQPSGDVAEAIDSVVSIFEAQFGERITIKNSVVTPVASVPLPTTFIKLVVFNLIRNAIDALQGVPNPEISISNRCEGSQIILEFRNNGPHIPQSVLSSLFESSVTTKNSGEPHGFGLRVVHKLILRANGTVRVSNVPNGGVKFSVELPASENKLPAPVKLETKVKQNFDGLRFLLIDDDESVREVLKLIIQDMGNGLVTTCSSGQEAIDLTDRNFEVVLLDMRMPGLSGQETFKRLAPELQRKVIFVTGEAFSTDSVELIKGFIQPVLTKPASFAQLCKVVAKITGSAA